MAMPKRFALFTLLLVAFLGYLPTPQAFAQLTIKPSSWNIIGLDSNKVTAGPDSYPVGVMITNNGGTTINNVTGQLVWDSANVYINLAGPATANIGSLAPGATTHLYFIVTITRNAAAYNTTRGYHIDVSGDGVPTVTTPTPRELFVEKLVSQFRNSIQSISGPSVVFVGGTYTYTLNGSTAPGGYEQLETFIPFPASIFQVVSLSATYTQPPGATNDKFYADASGWDNDPTSPTYRSSIGPEQYPGGKAGGTVVLTYTLKVIGAGAATVSSLIYDFSGSSYHYNSDYGAVVKSITSYAGPTAGIDLVVEKSHIGNAVKGQTFNHTVIVTNIGDTTTSGNITVEDLDPHGKVTVIGGSGTNWSYNDTTNTFTYSGPALTTGQSAPQLTVTVQIAASGTPASYNNFVTVAGGSEPAGNAGNNTGNDGTTIVDPLPDLTIVKAHTGNFARNATGQYTITVRNIGTGPTTNNKTVTVTDTLPAGLTFNSWTGTGWTYAAGPIWTRKDVLAINTNYPDIVLTVNVLGSAPDSVTNAVNVATTETEADTTNNDSSDPTAIVSARQVSGTVYNDTNHNSLLDTGETGAGLPLLYAKLILNSAPTTVYQWVQVTAGTGSFTIAAAAGLYTLIVDDNNDTSDVTPNLPAGWLGIQIPSLTRAVTVTSTTDATDQNFGLYNGSKITGKVFADTGIGGGTPNNGVQDGGEVGLENVAVKATNQAQTVTHDMTTTIADGSYTVWIPATAAVTRIIETNPSGYLSVSGSPGTTAGTYDRPTDRTEFTNTAGTIYTGVNFGDARINLLLKNQQQTVSPGMAVFYRHTFIAGSGGTLGFTTTAVNSPAMQGWKVILYYDANGNGQIDGAETVFPASLAVTAEQKVYLIVREMVPPGAPQNAREITTLTPSFVYTNASPALTVNTPANIDVTVVDASQGALKLIKSVDKPSARPGEVLTYTVIYINMGIDLVKNVVLSDPIDYNCTFLLGVFPGGKDILWQKPDGATVYLTTAVDADEGSLENSILYVRMGATLQVLPGVSGIVQYQVQIK